MFCGKKGDMVITLWRGGRNWETPKGGKKQWEEKIPLEKNIAQGRNKQW